MNRKEKAKLFLEATVVIAVVLALIMPATAVITNNDISANQSDAYERIETTGTLGKRPISTLQTTFAGNDLLVTPYEGDDYIPSITKDHNHVVVTWTNEQSFSESNMGISYSSNPTDETTWYDNSVVLGFSDPNTMFWDTAFLQGEKYTGLWGVYLAMTEEATGFYFIPDITTSYEEWTEFYTWSGGAPEPVMCEIVDHPVLQSCSNYPDIVGPWNFYVYHFEEMGYDIPQCPVFFRTDALLEGGGISYVDAQENEKTAPADYCDYFIKDENTVHVVLTDVESNNIIWKKMILDEEPDIEYTPYQSTIVSGTKSQMAGNSNNIVISYVDNGQVKAIYSNDDGENWQISTIGEGDFPNICETGGKFFIGYISGNNLYLTCSEDDGVTWSEPEQVNDVDGTVVNEKKAVDIHEAGIVWVDNRGTDYDVYYQPIGPILITQDIQGGMGLSANIKNIVDIPATNVEWTITAEGTVFIGKEKTGNIPIIAPGESVSISSFLLGFGDVGITIEAVCDEGGSTSASANGKLILFFLTGL